MIDIGAGRTSHGHSGGHRAGVEVFEVGDVDGIAGGLIVARDDAEVDGCDRGTGGQDQQIRTGAAVDRGFGAANRYGIVARARGDDIGAAAAVDDVGPGTAGDGVRARGAHHRHRLRHAQTGGVDILEIGNGCEIAHRLIGSRQVDGGGCLYHQGIGPGTAIDRDFGAVIIDGIVACAGVDDISAAAAMDDVVARSGGDRIGAGRTRDGQSQWSSRRR